MKIVKINIDSVIPYWRNPRNNEGTVKMLKKSIERYGFNQPLLIDRKNVIIVGHARYKALRELDYKEIPCIYSDISEEKAKEYRLADNKIHEETTWDEKQMMLELRDISNVDNMRDFYSDEDIDKLLNEAVGHKVIDVTDKKVSDVEDKLNTKFNDVNHKSRKVDVTCPACLEEFQIDGN